MGTRLVLAYNKSWQQKKKSRKIVIFVFYPLYLVYQNLTQIITAHGSLTL